MDEKNKLIRLPHNFVTFCSLCEEMSDDENDISFLFLTLAYNFANLVQYDKGYKGGTGLNTIRGVCNLYLSGSSNNRTSSVSAFQIKSCIKILNHNERIVLLLKI